MFTNKEIIEYRCPRWDELPDIELYMDQVLSVLERKLKIFAEPDEKIITSTMINNYVKQKVIKPPLNKRYDRYHLAYFYVICVLKRIFSVGEICVGIAKLHRAYRTAQAYDIFCDELEFALRTVFSGETDTRAMPSEGTGELIVRTAAMAFANFMYTKYLVDKDSAVVEDEVLQ